MRVGCALLLLSIGCTGRRVESETPPPAAAVLPTSPPVVASALPDAGVSHGRFRLRMSLAAGPDLTCFPSVHDFDVLPNGQAWFAGSCGIRVRLDAAGKFDDFRVPWKLVKFNAYGNVWAECPGTASFWGIWARSENEAFVVGDTRCGTDPNGIWYRPLEKFDGKNWSTTKVSFGKDPHDGIPWELAGNDTELYTLVEGDDWHGPPGCAVHRFGAGAWDKPELACPYPKKAEDRVMMLKNLAVAPDGTRWVVGVVYLDQKPKTGMVWTRGKGDKAWTEMEVDDLALLGVSVAVDGSVWLGGNSLWRKKGASFERLTTTTPQVGALFAQSSTRVWLARDGKPFVWIDGKELPVAIDAADDAIQRIDGAGEHVWASSPMQVWRLEKDTAAIPAVKLEITEPRTEHYPPEKKP